uniref:Cytochrome P450 n=1 Tax=Stomoxys calcitrans TaxID=35570 RepID=A0A1I8PLF2_STOCA
MLVLITLLLASLVSLWLWLKFHFSYWQRRDVPHNEPQIPAGNMHEWMRTKHFAQIFRETYEKFKGTGPYAGFYFHMQKAVLVMDPELAKNILIKDFSTFDRRGLFHNAKDDPLTANLFSLDGPKWKMLRAKLSPTFTSGKMRFMYPTVVKVGEQLEKLFEELLRQPPHSQVMEITDVLGRFTADVIGECAFGLDCNSLKDPSAEFCVMGRKFFTQRRHGNIVDGLIHAFPEIAQKLGMRVIHQEVHDFYMGIVQQTIAYRESHNVKRSDFMDMLIELKNQVDADGRENFTMEELTAQAFVFFVAGFDTSSTTMSYALYELAQQPEVQEKLRQEIEKVLEKHQQQFTYECMKDMKYLEQVISETLRKYPVAPALFRKSTAHYQTSDPKYSIEKGTMIITPSECFHHDSEYFPQPEKFDPERFSTDHVASIKPCTYLPFGEGPRNCIGMRFGRMQASIGLVQLLRKFRFSVCKETKIPVDFVIPSFNLNPLGGITLNVSRV